MPSNCFDGATLVKAKQVSKQAKKQSKPKPYMETNSTSTPSSNSTSSDFASSMYSCSIFPPKFTLPNSLSLTPSTLSDDDGDHHHEDCNTMHRLGQAQLVLECEELRDHLRKLNNEADSLRRENAVLRSANTDLVKLLKNLFNASSYVNHPFMADELKPLGFGVFSPRDGDEASDISPTSVIMEQKRFNADRFSLSKSISVLSSSSGYKNQPPLHEGLARVADQEGASGAMQVKKVKAWYNQGMVKTELCNKWQESGACPYGDNCQFAHGVRELRPVMRHPRYKTQICRMVLTGGTCPYGHRCHFRHSLNDHQHR